MTIVLSYMPFAVGIMDSDLRPLLAQVAQGDRAAFARLYDVVSGRLFGIISRILPRPELAEDALQETFMRIWQRASSYDEAIAGPMAWMATIARNQAIDLRRRSAERLAAAASELEETLADESPDPESLAGQAGDLRRLGDCMQGLPSERQQLVLLAYRQGFTREELAERFKRPVTTIKTLLRRSLIALKECLDGAR
ncbi:MAG: sigma-70 family RNA polymerase sigma factor [Pseudomonadota bacterium]